MNSSSFFFFYLVKLAKNLFEEVRNQTAASTIDKTAVLQRFVWVTLGFPNFDLCKSMNTNLDSFSSIPFRVQAGRTQTSCPIGPVMFFWSGKVCQFYDSEQLLGDFCPTMLANNPYTRGSNTSQPILRLSRINLSSMIYLIYSSGKGGLGYSHHSTRT